MKPDTYSVTIVWSDEVQAFVIFALFLFVLWLAGSPVRFSIGKRRPVKTWGPVDVRGHAMFGWPMEEEAKLEFTINSQLASKRRQHRDDAIGDA